MTRRGPLAGCDNVLAAPDAHATPARSASRVLAAAQRLAAEIEATPGLLESIASGLGGVPGALLGLLDCVNEYEVIATHSPT